MTHRHAIAFVAAALAAGLLASTAWAAEIKESDLKTLGSVPLRGPELVALSADGTRAAWTVNKKDQKKVVVVFDGKESPDYDAVHGLTLSNDGKHIAFAASHDGGWYIVYDGKESEKYSGVSAPAFSYDGKHVAFLEESHAVVDGNVRIQYSAVMQEPPAFSRDGKRVAYEAHSTGSYKTATVRDPTKAADPKAPPPAFVTPDGKQIDMNGSGSAPRSNFMVADEKPCEKANDVKYPVFSPDSKSLAYDALFGKLWFVVLDEKKVSDFFEDLTPVVFSPDGKTAAFAGLSDKKWTVVGPVRIDATYDQVTCIRFSPDGKHFAFAGKTDNSWVVVCDGKKSAPFDDVAWVGFSIDSSHLAFAARSGNAWSMVCDGVAGPKHQSIYVPPGAAVQAFDKIRYVAVDFGAGKLVEADWCLMSNWSAGLK